MKHGPRHSDNLSKIKADFRQFLALVWDHLGLPKPTALQYDIAKYLQHGPNRCCIQAFRGVGKSFVTSAYVLFELLRDPQKKILVVSASKNRADNFATFTLRLIQEMPILQHLYPTPDQRQSRIEFDVSPAKADQTPSVKSVGITGQLAGSRADIIVADDVEIHGNSCTQELREKLLARTEEFTSILKPLPDAKICFLGTPQTEDSIYSKLPSVFKVRIWPAEVPTNAEAEKYGTSLAPFVDAMREKKQPGDPTDPVRFNAAELASKRAAIGRSTYQLQFMLNTQLSDLERFPLKVKDLIVMDTAVDQGPMSVNWMPHPTLEWTKLPNVAMAGDRFYRPPSHSDVFAKYSGSVMAIDPSGRGKDETGYAVVHILNGFLYVRKAGGLIGGYDIDTLTKLANIAKDERVNEVIIEANFGDGMYTSLIAPVMARIHPCVISEVKHSASKEKRIIQVLEPLMNTHRLIFDAKVIQDDFDSARSYPGEFAKRTLIRQMAEICDAKGALKFDDRIDALAMACGFWAERVGQDVEKGIAQERDKALKRELKSFMKNALGQRGKPKGNFLHLPGR